VGGLKSLEGLYRREGCVHVMEVEVAHYFCITGGSRPAKSLPPSPVCRRFLGARRRRRLLMFVSVLNGGIYIGARSPPGGNRGREEERRKSTG
jgi:hypothetical protein